MESLRHIFFRDGIGRKKSHNPGPVSYIDIRGKVLQSGIKTIFT